MPTYEAYKDSGVQKIGVAPADWFVKKIKFLTKLNTDSLPENTQPTLEFEYVDIGSVSYENGIEKTEVVTFKDSPSRARRRAKSGDVVVSSVRTYLKAIAYVDSNSENFVYSTGFAVISPGSTLYPAYLGYSVKSSSFTEQVDLVAKGMSYPAINSTELGNLYLLEPPVDQQTLIANFLDQKTAQIDEAIAIKEQQIALLKERKQIIIQKAVTQGLNPDVPMKDSGVEWIGEIPAHWEVIKLKHLFSENTRRSSTGAEVLFSLRMELGLVPHNDVSDKPIPAENLIDYKIVDKGQMVMNRMRASIGIFGLGTDYGLVSPDYAVFDVSPEVIPEYYLTFFKLPIVGTQFRLASKGMGTGSSGFMRLYTDEFGNIKVANPPKEEQVALMHFIEESEKKTSMAVEHLQGQITKLKEYKTTLINSAVTGKIRITPEMVA